MSQLVVMEEAKTQETVKDKPIDDTVDKRFMRRILDPKHTEGWR